MTAPMIRATPRHLEIIRRQSLVDAVVLQTGIALTFDQYDEIGIEGHRWLPSSR